MGEPVRDASKAIHQRHLEDGIRDVLAAKRVMHQSLFEPADTGPEGDGRAQVLSSLLRGAWPALVIGVVALLVAVAALVVALVR